MKKYIRPLSLLAVSAFLVSFTLVKLSNPPATCTGSKNCAACKNCKYCKHCAKDGGSCGVCN